jgi:two-component system, OmpR family, phosphate regulon sensor histidine kinase PhoR
MSNVTKLTIVAVVRVAAIALVVGAVVTWLLGATAGLVAGGAIVFLCFALYARKLAQLSQWLADPQAATLPNAGGLWGEVLGDIYRVIRAQRIEQAATNDRLVRFEEAASALPDGAVMLDKQHNIVWCNPSAEKHWSISLERDRWQAITNLIRYPEFVEHLNVRQFGVPFLLRVAPAKGAIGDLFQPELILSLQLVRFGEEQILLVSADVSARERLETMRRDFVANVSHELRTPLTVLAGFAETAASIGASNPPVLQKALGHMQTQTARMQSLVEDLLTLSRLEDSRNLLTAAPVNVPELLGRIVADARALSGGAHNITTQIGEYWVMGNRDELTSAFSNLVFNAVRYTPPQGIIEVAWAMVDGKPMLAVKDNGEGIAAEHIPRLTERFYRVDNGRSRASGGTGLGLAIVKHVLMRHGATLDIVSSQHADRHGSTFAVSFPAARACEANSRPKAVAA